MKVIVFLVLVVIAIFYFASPETIKNAKEVATTTINDIQETTSQQIDSAKQVATTTINDMHETASKKIDESIQTGINEIKDWSYNTLEPMFPWMFIIFFFLLFAALKAVIPFSNTAVLQLLLVSVSYLLSVKLFYDMSLLYFAFIGTLWIVMPIAAFAIVFYFFKDKLIPLAARINQKIMGKLQLFENEVKVLEAPSDTK